MKRGKKKEAAPQTETVAAEDLTPAVDGAGEAAWDGPTRAVEESELAELAAQSTEAAPVDGEVAPVEVTLEAEPAQAAADGETVPMEAAADGETEPTEAAAEGEAVAVDAAADGELVDPEPLVESAGRLESILESLLYAADRALTVSDLKRLVNERDAKKITAALEVLRERHASTGIQLASLAGGWQFRTHPDNAPWVTKLVAGKPQRLSRAMLEALAIIAYRQPITRPEIDEIRGVDCGPVLKTLLDRGFVRILGKKEDVGRPMLYGTTPEFLKTFSLRDLTELPTLQEFHELSEQQMASVDAQAPLSSAEGAPPAQGTDTAGPPRSVFAPAPMDLSPVDQQEEDELLESLDQATIAATRASAPPPGTGAEASGADPSPEAQS
jgi:segregation and condensation protein B